jgi:hypothetical protein
MIRSGGQDNHGGGYSRRPGSRLPRPEPARFYSKESTPKGRGFGIAAPWKGAKRNPFKNEEKQ